MSKKNDERMLRDVHARALGRFEDIQSAMRNERLQCLKDRRFYSIAGSQWEGPLGEQFENKPKLEVNKVALSVMRIISEYRNNRITVNFVPKDGVMDDALSDACNGLYRADENDSTADEAYDNAFEEAVGGGFGAWRLRTVYEDEEDEENEQQRIVIDPIFDADSSVFFDLSAKRQDKSDAKFGYIISSMYTSDYVDEFNDDPASWPKDIQQSEFDWSTPDVVYIAEYFEIEYEPLTIYTFKAIDGSEEKYSNLDFENDEKLLDRLKAIGSKEEKKRKINRKRVRKYILSGGGVLEDCVYIAGKHIPIVPVYGKRWFIDNVERCMGHGRLATDVQRLKNMQLSKLAEISALSSIEKPILFPEQIAGHQVLWSEDNIKNYPYALINPITGSDGNMIASGPVGYTKSPVIPPAMSALLQITEQDMQDILGNQAAGEKVVSNISGKAVEMIQQKLDMQTYIYISNFAKAMKLCGQIWLSMAREIYIEKSRKMKKITKDDKADSITINNEIISKESGLMITENDIINANFDVDVAVGPSSSSQRSATVRSLTDMIMITDDPETKQVLGAMALMNMEGEGIDDARAYFRKKLIKLGVVKPTDSEIEEMMAEMQAEEKQKDPNSIFLNAAAEEAVAKASKARAETVETIANAEKLKAETEKTKAQTMEINKDYIISQITGINQ